MPKHLRWLLVPSLVLGVSVSSHSKKVEVDDARSIAIEFFGSEVNNLSISTNPVYIGGNSSNPLYYVFNAGSNQGFVIISAEDSANPVLGYSHEGSYPVGSVPEAMQWVMTGIERELKVSPTLQASRNTADLRRMAHSAGKKAAVKKLLATADWSQEAPFNSMIPGNPLVGCVGTAMATIMKYHQYPATGKGSFDGVEFNTPYSWSSMRTDNYRNGYTADEGNAVALLMYHASKSIDTQYAMSGSSAYEVRVPAALTNYFGYDPGVSYKKRADVATQAEWDAIVKNEIDEGRPVLYCGQDVSAGHAFVCDGYEGDYLHFNWGWGGSANGYFLTTALNPTVSRSHNYNNLNTIIYNIKPGGGTIAEWSPIHITADGNQPGIGSDLTNLSSGKTFTVRVGNLKNLSYSPFNGKIAVALCSADGTKKALLSDQSSLSLDAMAYLFQNFIDFRNCSLPAGTTVDATDIIRLMTLADGATEWYPVAGELLTVNELSTNISSPASFNVTFPSAVDGVTIEGAGSVIRGWNYSFKVTPTNPAEKVVTVKGNGNILTPGNNYSYTINNVCSDQEITVLVQDAADVKEKRSVWVGTAGTLSNVLSEEDAAGVKELTLFGTIDARDFNYINSSMHPKRVDLSGVQIVANGSNQANAIPRDAFRGMGSLEEVVLPSSVNRLNNGCFRQCGIKTITIPANVKTYEYNVFCAASKLRHIYVGRETAEFINWCVLSGVPTASVTLHVPNERAVANYSKAENWKDIANIIVDPVVASDKAMFAVMDNNEVNFECETAPGLINKGTEVIFSAKHIVDNDNRMDVYANNTLLSSDGDGNYKININGNTIVHFDMVSPMDNIGNSQWTLTAANGSIGMFSEAVNVIQGQQFSIRINALNIPSGLDQLYWGIALTDASDRIKEFVSPVNLWTAGSGSNFRMTVNCIVKDSKVREGNKLRLVTSGNKKHWNIVKGADESITDALPALNNACPVYNISIPQVTGATISGAVSSAVRGQDITLKIVPANAAFRVDVIENGVEVVKGSPSVNYTFVAMEDKSFDIKIYDPKEYGSVTYNVRAGELYNKVTQESIRAHVIVTGEVYASDLNLAFSQSFVSKVVKKLDLSGVNIVAGNGREANVIPSELFFKTSAINPVIPVVEEVILPETVEIIETAAFKNCAYIKDITLPLSLIAAPRQTTLASGGKKYVYGIGDKAFMGCTSLSTIRIPGATGLNGSRQVVAHQNPYNKLYYSLMDDNVDYSKVTVVVPPEYLSIYKTAYNDNTYGNAWKSHGYNILSEYPVYSLNFDPNRCEVEETLDVRKAASFLGDNVSLASISTGTQLKLKNPEIKCLVFDNDEQIEVGEDGSIPVTFHNPAVSPDKSGDHNIRVVYTHDLTFNTTSPLFTIDSPEVSNEDNYDFATLDTSNPEAIVLHNIAEQSKVRFRMGFSSEHTGDLEARVMSGQQEIMPDEEGYYTVEISGAPKTLDIFAVPTNGATLNEEEISALNPAESAAITDISLAGDISAETFAYAMECFPALESLDLSEFTGELPDAAFENMESLSTVALPQVDAISPNMFKGCSSLSSIDIPTSVNAIGEGAFKDCSSLESIKLTGIDEIGEGAFDGCTKLTSITILNDVAAGETPSQAMKKGKRRAAGIHTNAFNGLNPNCIVVLDEGISAPSASANYLNTALGTVTETQPDGTTAEREGRIYSAAGNISFADGYPLYIPHAFTISEGHEVNFEADIKEGWKGIVIPFDVETITGDDNRDIKISTNTESDRKPGYHVLYGIQNAGNGMERSTAITANVPYYMYSHLTGRMTFAATQGKVPSTPSVISAEGNDLTLHATYTENEVPSATLYELNEDTSAFVPVVSDEENTVIYPFGVYVTSPTELSEIPSNLPSRKVVTSVEEMEISVKEFRVITENGLVVVYSPDSRTETLYSEDGKVIRKINLQPGRNVIEGISKGIYIISDFKVIM